MPSQIKVDEIKNVAGQYKIKTNVFEGQTTAGSISIQGEGSATTNLQQGLLKVWNNFDGTATNAASRDSFNVSGMTDDATGTATTSYTNAMNNANYSAITIGEDDSSNQGPSGEQTSVTTSSIQFETRYQGNNTVYDLDRCHVMISGDLA
tara:strand:- start:276 stop:725 length:450 start_codon:yes stop_codon:yes gene_type:complete